MFISIGNDFKRPECIQNTWTILIMSVLLFPFHVLNYSICIHFLYLLNFSTFYKYAFATFKGSLQKFSTLFLILDRSNRERTWVWCNNLLLTSVKSLNILKFHNITMSGTECLIIKPKFLGWTLNKVYSLKFKLKIKAN